MKKYKLDPEELQILKDFDEGKFKSISVSKKEKKRFQKIAKYTLKKTKNVNLRLSAEVLEGIKARAEEEGLPYQTLISSILHKYVRAGK